MAITTRRILLFVILALVAAGGVAAVYAYRLLRGAQAEWTTCSPKALEELDRGLKDLAKAYDADAVRHFEKALELDPDFAMAKVQLAALYPSPSERKRLHEELRHAEVDGLQPRERFLLSHELARFEGRDADAAALIESFLEQHPDDPFGLQARCKAAWRSQAWDDAERCYDHLLALHPNRVEGWNNLGHIALARGRFDEAEERFRTYRYLAPDQASPYHSLAVLATIRGDYSEALEKIEETIRIKPDFCAAYTQRLEAGFMSGRFEQVAEALADVEGMTGCDQLREQGILCTSRAWLLYLEGDADGAWAELEGGCLERLDGFDMLAHRIAVMTGRVETAVAMERVVGAYRDKVEAGGRPVHARLVGALLAHMQGIRELAGGDLGKAADLLSAADEELYYWGGERPSIKLFNRLNLLRTLELAGRTAKALALRRQIDAINPRLVDDFPLPDVDALRRVGSPGLPASFLRREDQHQ